MKLKNPSSVYSHGSGNTGFGTKDSIDVECGDLSERQSQVDFLTTMVQKSSSHEEASEASAENSSVNEVKDIIESLAVASSLAPASRLSFLVPPTPSTTSNEELSSQRCSLPIDSTPCQMEQRFCSGSLCGGPSEGWSLPTSSELVASTQTERCSFDSENLDSAHGKVTYSRSSFFASPSIDLRTCGFCSKLLLEKLPWVAQKIVISNDLSVVAVLVCGHVYRAERLENRTPETYRFDPPYPVCTTGDKQVLKVYGKNVKIDTELKGRNRKRKNVWSIAAMIWIIVCYGEVTEEKERVPCWVPVQA